MAQLENVLNMIEARRAAAKKPDPTPQTFIETKWMSDAPESSGSGYLDRMVAIMDTDQLSSDEIKEGFIALAAGLVELDTQVEQYGQGLARMSEAVASISSRVDSLTMDLTRLVEAIRGIHIPETKLPAIHVPDVDLSPITQAIGDLRIMVASLEREAEVEEKPEPPEEWTFEIKRGPSGLIKSVEVKEK